MKEKVITNKTSGMRVQFRYSDFDIFDNFSQGGIDSPFELLTQLLRAFSGDAIENGNKRK